MADLITSRQEKEKSALIEALKEMPIVHYACKKTGVGRATYYRWKDTDRNFRRQADDALIEGRDFINDISESQLVALIKEKKMPAIAMWLKHNNSRYGLVTQKGRNPVATLKDLAPEELELWASAQEMTSGTQNQDEIRSGEN